MLTSLHIWNLALASGFNGGQRRKNPALGRSKAYSRRFRKRISHSKKRAFQSSGLILIFAECPKMACSPQLRANSNGHRRAQPNIFGDMPKEAQAASLTAEERNRTLDVSAME
jgi:hypothetical protein